jgi:hypothetical protein
MAKLIGNQPNQVPTNGDLGTMAYQDSDNVVVGNLSADGAVVINESGADVDFRIESDTNTHAFFLEGSSGNVGIGTSSPASLLTVKKGTEADQANQPSGTFAATVYHASNASGANGLLVKNNWAASTSTVFEAGLDLIGTGYRSYFKVAGDGNVGIGTSSPADALHVIGSGRFTRGVQLGIDGVDATSYISQYRSTVETIMGPLTTRMLFGTVSNHDIAIQTNNAEAMRITSTGSVGIGTSNPAVLLDVLGDGLIQRLRSTTSTGAYLRFDGTGTSFPFVGLLNGIGTFGNTDASPIRFTTNSAERMRIDSTGSVGIGTSSPAATLSVHQSDAGLAQEIQGTSGVYTRLGTSTTSLYTVHSTTDTYIYTQESAALRFGTAATERMRIDSSGNVGIGTTNFSQPAKVIITGANAGLTAGDSVEIFRVGDGRGNSASDGLRLSAVRDTTAGSYGDWHTQTLRLERNIDNVAPQSGIDFSPSILKLRTSGAERMRIDSSGNTTPGVDNTQDLGSSSKRWNDLYVGGGVYLGGTGAANYLDDYEEGTWTPTLPSGWAATPNYAHYTKIGRMVYASVKETITTEGSGNFTISVPFTCAIGTNGAVGQVFISGLQAQNWNQYTAYIGGGSNLVSIYGNGTTAGWNTLGSGDWAVGAELYIHVVYAAA